MRKTLIIILILLFCVKPAGAAENSSNAENIPIAGNQEITEAISKSIVEGLVDRAQGKLTLNEACRITLEKNPGVHQALERIKSAKAVLLQNKSPWKPSISASGHAMAIDAVEQPDWAQEVRAQEAFNEYSAGIQMSWLIFDGFIRDADLFASKYNLEKSKQVLEDTRRLLLKAVSITFYQAQLAIENMIIAMQNQAFNRRLEADARIKWRVGTSPEAEMLNFSVRVLQAETDYLAAQRDFDITCSALARLMAVEGGRLSSKMRPVQSKGKIPDIIPDFENEIKFAVENRPDIKALDLNILSLQQKSRAQKGSYYPKFYLVSGLNYLYQQNKLEVDEEEHNTYIGVNARWEIYSGGIRNAKIQEINAGIGEIKEKKRETLLSIQTDIHQAIDRARIARATYERQQETLKLTRRIRDHVEKAYRAGVATLTRLNEAQTDLVSASGAAAASLIKYRIALVNIDATTGKINM